MSEIANLLQQKAGLSPEKSQEVEQIVIEHLTAKVPPQFQGILGSVLGTGANSAEGASEVAEPGGLSGMLGAVTGMFGGNKA
jgi:hypothetical protein